MKIWKRWLACLLIGLLAFGTGVASAKAQTIEVNAADTPVQQGEAYTSMEEVAVYLTLFGELPDNFITKNEAQALGWNSRAGNLDEVAPGKSIGGDYFGNYEGNVPNAKGRSWTECDIDSDGGYRNGLRIVFSNDGLIYYSDDHYNTFAQVVVDTTKATTAGTAATTDVAQDQDCLTLEDVVAYLRTYGTLSQNFLTKKAAQELGWSSKKNNLNDVAPGCAIGGDLFGNREGLLPDAEGRIWYECDVNTVNGKRSDERLVWSNDGLMYYTADNHRSFEPVQ